MLLLILKLLVVIIFLVIFLRRTDLVWGIGLLTVTTAVLLDTFLGAFGREAMRAELGFFYFVLAGGLFGGAALWIWGVLRPYLPGAAASPGVAEGEGDETAVSTPYTPLPSPGSEETVLATDQQMLLEQIQGRFGREDMLDLVFDLGLKETEVVTFHQTLNELGERIVGWAARQEQTAELGLAVERILTPAPPEHLPRREKLDVNTPPTLLRQFLMAHYTLDELEEMAAALGLDWDAIGAGGKQNKVRELLLYLYRRNRIDELIDYLHDDQ